MKQVFNRREFLRLLGLSTAALGVTGFIPAFKDTYVWPRYRHNQLPAFIQQVIEAAPNIFIDNDGILNIQEEHQAVATPLVPTVWNQNRQHESDRLESDVRWGIVLHWFGDEGPKDQDLDAYLRGFDAVRPVFNYETRTSAHFLVGSKHPADENKTDSIGIVQTQQPDTDGVPFLASHLQALDYTAHWDKRQYFVRAYYQLAYKEQGSVSVLQEFFDSPQVIDPNKRTIAIEVTGTDFDSPGKLPAVQKIANTAALTWAVMKKYRIRATDVLGHHEIQLGKSDPGKKFVSLIRYLIGILALRENNPVDLELVFGTFTAGGATPNEAVERYFNFVRDYLVLIGTPVQVYEWEGVSNFWLAFETLIRNPSGIVPHPRFIEPVRAGMIAPDTGFLNPANHEGVHFYVKENKEIIRLISSGLCLYAGDTEDHSMGKMALFKHRQEDGAEIISVYANIDALAKVKAGVVYPQKHPVGWIEKPNSYQDASLYFAIAYGATWDTDLINRPYPPPNAGPSWIMPRYIDPVAYLDQHTRPLPLSKTGIYYD